MNIIGVVITDGVGYRNYILSDFLQEVVKKYDKVVVFSGISIEQYPKEYSNLEIVELPVFVEGRLTWFYRKLKELAHLFLHRNKTFGIRDTLSFSYPKTNSPRALLTKLAFFIAKNYHTEKNIKVYEKFQFKSFKNSGIYKNYTLLLKQYTPNQLFFTHQRPPFLAPLVAAADELKIQTTTFIFSWDNLASKGRMLGTFKNYLVWSDLMKQELLEFYPEVSPNHIKVVGTPQFEPYVLDRYHISRDEFYNKFNLNSSQKIICYSCADSSIGKNDEIHIRAILSFINKTQNLQLLVRTSPAEDGKRFERLKNEFPEIKWNFPKWFLSREGHAEAWSQRLPSIEDINDLKAILQYSDVNVNMLSTMSLDFMLFDKPVVNTVFGNKENGLYDDQRFLNYVHYKYVVDSGAVTIATNENELHRYLEEALQQPNLRSKERKQLIDLEIGAPLEGTSQRIVEALKSL
ncbi:hypothetical protein [Wenyingzhuangia marina]|uniref:CDP-Glycerol:Poly(Glycerophosphate) glycerophosphotransferase n=1 Tax=Wenyingzhuangia marina TaxID=1195760 RepID=A0A1M5U9K2_9FLAO|nr:hypothetical protein [Wenyingzhuangia marina]GGF68849.1 hypothetical protein GCM10011397_09770 [Wenyingzhuangia marina]SHH59674.1 hypothetical protein SAMN05444281_1118 [Wenyingzhuangia marina]